MHAYLIDPTQQTVETVELPDGLDGIRRLIRLDSVDSDATDPQGDRLYFDESCFIRPQPHPGRFQFDSLAPLAGRAVLAEHDAATQALVSPQLGLDALKARVRLFVKT